MKTILYFWFALSVSLFICNQSDNKANAQNHYLGNPEKGIVQSNTCLSLIDAEKILGQSAKQKESTTENKNGITKFRCTFTANSADPKTNKTANLYYLLEEYPNEISSIKAYSDILEQNKNLPGLKKINEISDQAFLHTDGENFVIIISRKNNKILRLKVNKLTSMTSIDELQNISKKITETL